MSRGVQEQEIYHLLPLVNEVWGKVMFLHLCVIVFTRGGSLPMGGLCPGASLSKVVRVTTPSVWQRAGGMHPTCNKIGQMLDFARSAYSYNLELVRHLAFRIKRNFAFRLFIDN